MKQKVDWYNVAVIVALGAVVTYVMIILGRSSIGWVIP